MLFIRAVTGAILFSSISTAQSGRSELFGTVADPSRLPIVHARIDLESAATAAHISTETNERGSYHLLGLDPGAYSLTAGKPGFRPYRQTGLTLPLDTRIQQDISLEIGESSQTVEVSAESSLLQTASGAVEFHVDNRRVVNLPLDGRNFIPLVALAPGVALPQGSFLPRIDGSRPRTNEYLYDGISVLQPEPGQVAFYPIVDAIEEFKLNTNAYSPEYGRSNGGTVIVGTKSGSNAFHGTIFEFFRNEVLNARNLFATTGPRPEFRRNIYGFVLGGPIQHNRTFFFADYQGSRLRTGVTRISTVPTTAQRNGVFIAPIYDPVTRQPFANNTIPASRLDPIALQVLGRYPLPNVFVNGAEARANNYRRTASEPDDQDQFDTRLDRYFGTKHRIFGRYSFLRDDDDAVTPLPDGSGAIASGTLGHAVTRGDGLVLEYNWSPSPSVLNEARFGWTRRDLNRNELLNGNIQVPGVPSNAFGSALPLFTLAGYQQIGPSSSANSRFTTSVTEFLDTFSIVRGRHTIKFGTDIRREALDVLQPPNPTGAYAFNTLGTNRSGVAGSGDSVASLLLGQVNAFTIDLQSQALQERAKFAEFFVGDDWRVTPRLTLNLGTRYTFNFPSTEANGRGAVFNLKTQKLDFPHTARELECCDFGPRAGISYRLNDSLVLRSGYGLVFFEQTGITTPFTLPQFPFIQTTGQQSPDNIAPAFVLSQGPSIQVQAANPNSGLGQGVFGAQRDNGSGYSQNWNFTVQKTFGSNFNAEIAYTGSKNTRLGVPDSSLNQLPVSALALGSQLLQQIPNPYFGIIPPSSSLGGPTVTRAQLLRPYPQFTTVTLFRDNTGNSSYHSLQARFEKRFSRGLEFSFAYTFSKLIDDASSVFDASILTGPVANFQIADSFNKKLEKDLSNGDIPHVFSAGWVYDVPRLWKIAGWHVAGLVRLQSGDTVSVTQSPNYNSFAGFGTQRPNRVSNPNDFPARSTNEWFNIAAFTVAPQFTLGNSSRNPVRGPGFQEADLMLGKVFRITERFGLDFRAEVFNVTNTPPLNDPNGTSGTAAFGTITSAGNPRVFEFAAKVLF